MNAHMIERQFAKIGARALVRNAARRNADTGVRIDIGHDLEGEFFDIAVPRGATSGLIVVDAQPRLRHLLLLSRQDDDKYKFLCGHDERHWFVAAVPERLAVSTVRTAFEALKPDYVRHVQNQVLRVKPRKRNRRRNDAFIRQGEWFFVPAPIWFRANEKLMLRNPQVFVRGRIRHPDHKTIVLSDWHQVLMNTETQSVAMQHVAFID
jgi:hypothetical protein